MSTKLIIFQSFSWWKRGNLSFLASIISSNISWYFNKIWLGDVISTFTATLNNHSSPETSAACSVICNLICTDHRLYMKILWRLKKTSNLKKTWNEPESWKNLFLLEPKSRKKTLSQIEMIIPKVLKFRVWKFHAGLLTIIYLIIIWINKVIFKISFFNKFIVNIENGLKRFKSINLAQLVSVARLECWSGTNKTAPLWQRKQMKSLK